MGRFCAILKIEVYVYAHILRNTNININGFSSEIKLYFEEHHLSYIANTSFHSLINIYTAKVSIQTLKIKYDRENGNTHISKIIIPSHTISGVKVSTPRTGESK